MNKCKGTGREKQEYGRERQGYKREGERKRGGGEREREREREREMDVERKVGRGNGEGATGTSTFSPIRRGHSGITFTTPHSTAEIAVCCDLTLLATLHSRFAVI